MRKLVTLVLALCLLYSATCAMAEENAEAKQEIKVGKMTFQIPADFVNAGSLMAGEGYEAQIYMNNEFVLVVSTLDLDVVEATIENPHKGKIEDTSKAMLYGLRLIAGMDIDTAYSCWLSCTTHNANLPHNELIKKLSNEAMSFIAFAHNGTGVLISPMLNEGVTNADHSGLGIEIAKTFAMEESEPEQ